MPRRSASARRGSRASSARSSPRCSTELRAAGVEGSFEYVANYLYSEVYGADRAKAAGFWNQVWSVAEPPQGGDPVRTRLPGFDQKRLLQEMIDEGLDATWKAIPVQELVKVKAGTAEPAKSMKVIQREAWDYLAAISNWTPWPETSGVGFHTTDGAPGQVAQDKGAGGWGGITRTITVPFFKQRYGLGQDWNPLGTWLEEKGPTFRKGIKDNELLSTVSVATASHGSVRFPLADTAGRKGTHKVRHAIAGAEQDTFHMQVYMYVVRVARGTRRSRSRARTRSARSPPAISRSRTSSAGRRSSAGTPTRTRSATCR